MNTANLRNEVLRNEYKYKTSKNIKDAEKPLIHNQYGKPMNYLYKKQFVETDRRTLTATKTHTNIF